MPDLPDEDAPRAPQLLVPEVDDESAGFWEATARGVLAIQSCVACGALRHPPRPMCPRCNATDRGWQQVSGRGTIWSHIVAHPPLLPAYAALAPYNVVVVALDEDPTIRLIGNLIESEGEAPNAFDREAIDIGARVRVVFERRGALQLPQWVRV